MKNPIDDTRWAAGYGSAGAVQAAFDRFGPDYHAAILATDVPAGAARTLLPFLAPEARGIDLGCGSGVLGLALREEGLSTALDGIDLSPGMLELARATGCYRRLERANLLLPAECPRLDAPYDFAVTVGLIGDYVPYYLALPFALSLLRPGAVLGFAVEQASTPWAALEKDFAELRLEILAETSLSVPEAALMRQEYGFFVARLPLYNPSS
jgi:predicted TPR repeat methyltransferase